jgi:hypothetical protein
MLATALMALLKGGKFLWDNKEYIKQGAKVAVKWAPTAYKGVKAAAGLARPLERGESTQGRLLSIAGNVAGGVSSGLGAAGVDDAGKIIDALKAGETFAQRGAGFLNDTSAKSEHHNQLMEAVKKRQMIKAQKDKEEEEEDFKKKMMGDDLDKVETGQMVKKFLSGRGSSLAVELLKLKGLKMRDAKPSNIGD